MERVHILKVLEGKKLTYGNKEIMENIEGFNYPLKIVVFVEERNGFSCLHR